MDKDFSEELNRISEEKRVELLSKTYDRLNGLTGNADTKAAIILTFHSFWAISFGTNLSKLIVTLPASHLKMVLWAVSFLLTCAFFIAFVRSAYQSVLILVPRIEQIGGKPKKLSLLFFGDIIRMPGRSIAEKAESYIGQLNETGYDDIVHDLTYRINDVANVVNEKYECTKKAVRRSIYTFFLWAISLMTIIIMNMF